MPAWLKWGLGFLIFYLLLWVAAFVIVWTAAPDSWDALGAFLIVTFPGNILFGIDGVLDSPFHSSNIFTALTYFVIGSLIGSVVNGGMSRIPKS